MDHHFLRNINISSKIDFFTLKTFKLNKINVKRLLFSTFNFDIFYKLMIEETKNNYIIYMYTII